MCRREQLDSPRFLSWAERMRPAWDLADSGEPVFVHRKLWEWRGVAVHTTEFDVGSNHETIDHEATVLFRRRDLQGLARWLYSHGHRIRLDFRPGTLPDDDHVDAAPFQLGPPSHGDPRLHDHLVRTHRPEGPF